MTLTQLFFSFDGRVSRKTYWLFVVAFLAICLAPAALLFAISTEEAADAWVTIASLLMLWPALAIQAKRWHDREKSAWWLLINLIPIVGFWALVENGFLAGTAGDNRYGSDPLQRGK